MRFPYPEQCRERLEYRDGDPSQQTVGWLVLASAQRDNTGRSNWRMGQYGLEIDQFVLSPLPSPTSARKGRKQRLLGGEEAENRRVGLSNEHIVRRKAINGPQPAGMV